MMSVEITIVMKDNYNQGQLNLIRVWNEKLENFKKTKIDSGFILFAKPKGKKPSTQICGIDCQSSGCVSSMEWIRMSIENYTYLMAKCGIEVTINV